MLRRTLGTSFIVVALLSVGCTLVTDFEKTHSDAAIGGTGGRGSIGGVSGRFADSAGTENSASGTTTNTAGTTTSGPPSVGGSGVANPSGGFAGNATSNATSGTGSQTDSGIGGTGIGTVGGALSGGALSGGTSSGGSTLSTAGKPALGGSGGAGGMVASGSNASSAGIAASQGGNAGTGTMPVPTKCTIGTTPYVADYVNTENACESCQPSASSAGWSPRPEGTPCGTHKICIKLTCTTVCSIGGETYLPGTANPDNPCQSCDTTKALDGWSDTPTSRCVTAISAGSEHTCAIVNKKGYCWGSNVSLQLGTDTGALSYSLVPLALQIPGDFQSMTTGESHTCAVIGTWAYCWGSNEGGKLGIGVGEQAAVPTNVQNLPSNVGVIVAAANSTCATQSGNAYCWGDNQFHQLGVGADTGSAMPDFAYSPVGVEIATGVTAIAIGATHGCAVLAGNIWCWGSNQFGQLGPRIDGTDPTLPAKVVDIANATAVAVGSRNQTCAVISGAIRCWGGGDLGQLGDGRGTDSVTPVAVKGLTNVTAIDSGDANSCAISDGSAYCWGGNMAGQVGDGTRENRVAPVQVLRLSKEVTAISAGPYHACAVMSGNAYCWGANLIGQLGNNSQVDSSVPVMVQFP